MFSDIAGYTAIMARDEREGLEARDSHRELLRAILPRFNGRLGDLSDGALSERVYEEIRNKPEFEVKDLGEQSLKNVPRPIRVYTLAAPGSTGERLIQPSTAAARERKRIPWLVLAGAAALAGLLYVAVTLKPWFRTSAPFTGATHPIRSIVVLPLDNYSGDPKQEYFAEGMTDELTTDLAKISLAKRETMFVDL
jgi:hypothetical protein